MIGSDEELRKAEERDSVEPAQEAETITRESPEAEQSDEQLVEVAPTRPEDVARKILREALKSFPIPGKK